MSFSFGRTVGALFCALTLSVGLGACAAGEPKDAASLVEKVKTAADADNYHMSGSMSIGSMGMNIPVNIDMDCVGNSAHGSLNMSFIADIDGELYISEEDGKCVQYMKSTTSFGGSTDESDWQKISLDKSSISAMNGSMLLDEQSLSKAQFASDNNGYTLTFDNVDMPELTNSLGSLTGSGGAVDTSSLDISNMKAVAHYDKSYHIDSLTFDMSGSSEMMGTKIDMNMNMNFAFNNYGKVDENTVKVPINVTATAKEFDSSSMKNYDLGSVDSVSSGTANTNDVSNTSSSGSARDGSTAGVNAITEKDLEKMLSQQSGNAVTSVGNAA